VPDGVERQNLERSWGEDTGIVDQEIQAAIAESVRHPAGPGFHGLLFGDVADGQADTPAGDLLQILDLRRADGRAEDDIAFGGKPERDIAAEATARAGDRGGSAPMFGLFLATSTLRRTS
jgi:hypothetical protein